jgi:uncharacterized protein (DUF433 family)
MSACAEGSIVRASLPDRDKARHPVTLHAELVKGYAATMKSQIVTCNPDVMGGAAVFYGTRLPVQTLLDYLEAGESIDDFLAGFPSVTRQQVIAFLEEAKDRLIETVS